MTRFSTFKAVWHGCVKGPVRMLNVFTKATTEQWSRVVRGLANVEDSTREHSHFATVRNIYAVLNPVGNGNRSLANRLDSLESGKPYSQTSLLKSLTAGGSPSHEASRQDREVTESTLPDRAKR